MQGQIRIIGGLWRGRKLQVPDVPGLRPTPNRVRETLFNWLQPVIAGTYCLDLFAGSGALGFEALSRGATKVVLVDQSAGIVNLLRNEAERFKITQAEVYQGIVPEQLKKPEQPFDIVFLDPPYEANLLLPCCFYLEENAFLAENAYVYLEDNEKIPQTSLPSNWQLLKVKQAGQVIYHLAKRTGKIS